MSALAIFQQFGPGEIVLILLIAMVLFGAKRLPEIGKSLGRGIKEFKAGVKGLGDDVREGMEDDTEPKPSNVKGSTKDRSDG